MLNVLSEREVMGINFKNLIQTEQYKLNTPSTQGSYTTTTQWRYEASALRQLLDETKQDRRCKILPFGVPRSIRELGINKLLQEKNRISGKRTDSQWNPI